MVLLSAKDEDMVLYFADLASYSKLPYAVFIEDDLGPDGEYTAMAVLPDEDFRRKIRELPMALK